MGMAINATTNHERLTPCPFPSPLTPLPLAGEGSFKRRYATFTLSAETGRRRHLIAAAMFRNIQGLVSRFDQRFRIH